MQLNDIWGYGQLFAFSGLDGLTKFPGDFVATLDERDLCFRFGLGSWTKVYFPIEGEIRYRAVTGDMVDAETAQGDFFIAFASASCLVGYSPVEPKFEGRFAMSHSQSLGADLWSGGGCFGMVTRKEGDLYKFSVYYTDSSSSYARNGCKRFLETDVHALKRARYAYYENLPACKNERYEKLYYKALSVNKVNVHSPVGRFPCRWTTPDRVPHRNMWLWDSAFHALAIATYDTDLAKEALRAVLSQADEDGHISCMMNPHDYGVEQTQPQMLAWAVWEVYQKSGDTDFLKESLPALEGYLKWDMQNRDRNENGLLEWFIEPDTPLGGGESGWDNSPRFDTGAEMDAVDFSSFMAHDAKYLALVCEALGEREKAEEWRGVYERIKRQISTLLWDEEDGVFYDRVTGGSLTKVLTPASFFPMFAGVPTREQAERMVRVLTDENLLWTKSPLATIAKTHPAYSDDYWRGGSWLNCNYFVVKGLKEYGFDDIAQKLIDATLATVDKWYQETGTIFELYDPEGETNPFYLTRIGKEPLEKPDWQVQYHTICDFNWSASFTLLFIQNELY